MVRGRVQANERCRLIWLNGGQLSLEYSLDWNSEEGTASGEIVQAFPVHSIEAANRFYTRVLGAGETKLRSVYFQDYPLLGQTLVAHHVGDDYRCRDVATESVVPFPHFGIRVTERQYAGVLRRLRKHGVPYQLVSSPQFDGQTAVFFKDPSGNNVYVHGVGVFPPPQPGARRHVHRRQTTPDVAADSPPPPPGDRGAAMLSPGPAAGGGLGGLPDLPERSSHVSKSGRRGLAAREVRRGPLPTTCDVDGVRWFPGALRGERRAVPLEDLDNKRGARQASPTRSDPGAARPDRPATTARHRRKSDTTVTLPKAAAAPKPQRPRTRAHRRPLAKLTKLPNMAEAHRHERRSRGDWKDKAGNAENIWDQFKLREKQREADQKTKAWVCVLCGHTNEPALDLDGTFATCDACSAKRVSS